MKSLKARLAQLKATVPQPKLPDVTNIHGAQGQIIDNIGSGVMSRLAGLGARLRMATVTRGWDVVYDEGKHPRGANGRYIGGSQGLKSLAAYQRFHQAINYHKTEATNIRDRGVGTKKARAQAAKAYLARATIDEHQGLPALQAQEQVLVAHLTDVARNLTPTDLQELQALHYIYEHRTFRRENRDPHDSLAHSEYRRLSAEAEQIKTLIAKRNSAVVAYHKAHGLPGKPQRITLTDRAGRLAAQALTPATRLAINKHIDRLNVHAKAKDAHGPTARQQDINRLRQKLRDQHAAQEEARQAVLSSITIVPESQRPIPQTTTDAYGQLLPFTHADFNAARAQGIPLDPAQKGINDAAFVTIGATRYVLKTAVPNYFGLTEIEQHHNEAATGAAMRALGLGHLVPPSTYHLVGSDGRHYTLVVVVPGTPVTDITTHDLRQVRVAHLEQAVLAEFTLGMLDRHGANILVDRSTGQLTEIDHAFGFASVISFGPRVSSAWMMLALRTDTSPIALQDRVISSTVVRQLLRHVPQLTTALQRYHLTTAQTAAVLQRFAHLQQLSDAKTPITLRSLTPERTMS